MILQYVPYVGDSKRAMDEYTSEIFMGGKNTIVLHNTCEDSLLAAPIILDLVLLAELSTRIQLKAQSQVTESGGIVRSVDISQMIMFNLIFISSHRVGEVPFFPSSGHHPELSKQGSTCKCNQFSLQISCQY
jgi:hypothetical protein